MVRTRTTQRESPPRGQGRGQPPSVNPGSQSAPVAAPQHQQTEGVGEHNPQYPNAVASDPVTAQLNAMQQQFGVFQLVLAQLLARNNPADPLIHLLNPAPPVAPQPVQQPANSPVRSAAPNASQAQSHMLPQPQNPPQPAASDVSKRLDNLEKLLAENKDPQPQTPPVSASIPTPLGIKITQEPYPPGFRMPQFETYDGTKDPDDHLHAFFSIMQAQNASDALMCKIRLIKKTTPELMRITQREDESLKNYMNRFNDAMLEVNAFDEAVGVTAVMQGLNHDRFRDNLIKNTPTTFDEVNQRSLKFIKAEDKVLQGAEQRYSIAEKAALTVVVTARKLRPYFQSHPIIVMTDQPLRQILQKPECSGRLIKWAVELGEFQIAFQQRSTIRAQTLANFVVECTSNQVKPNSEVETWTLYVDGSSNNKGSGAGAVLTGPDGFRSEHALKFNFQATNNVAEYEALLLGLHLAVELKVKRLQIYSDSQLVVNQINSMCEVIDPIMAKYVVAVSELKNRFEKFQLTKISRAENEHADSLSKLTSENFGEAKFVYIEILNEPSFQTTGVMEISTDLDAPSWTDPIREYLLNGTVPEDKQEEMKLRRKASRYTLVCDILYKRSYSLPLLRCLTPYEAEYALREVHEGVCGNHVGARTLAHKVLRQGYYWPNMQEDAKKFVQRCQKCQFFAHLTHQPAEELTSLTAPWLFAQWGIDLLGPFVKAVGGATHLVVAVDYFTKWVEAKPLSCLTSRRIEDFLFTSVICRHGIPNQIIADNGPQFNCTSFKDFCSSYGIKLVFTSVYHPEANGMVESVNKAILEGIKPRLDQLKTKWVDELNNVLWAYRTTSRTATGEMPYHLAFGTEAVIPVEIGVPSLRISHFELAQNERLLREILDLLDEVREQSRLWTLAYKQRIANLYNKRVRPRNFRVGDLVLRKAGLTGFETRYGKLAPNWEGPYIVTEVPHPGAYILQDAEGNRVPRVWNVNNLKKFHP
ncbi:hypothetical protein SLEP1_g58870 [Rubroshorea leprosula]|uniref:Uncharacterized protein n=1 Tax=Rubroshorea leprosula TaxID=152421 RepID=A0AAV5MUT7_9ROSI|nr:hypothetical protein SLEP1_g58870 [Rubroshorea leprosula]